MNRNCLPVFSISLKSKTPNCLLLKLDFNLTNGMTAYRDMIPNPVLFRVSPKYMTQIDTKQSLKVIH